MGYRCKKCGLVCCNKNTRNYHEAECDDTIWKENRDLYNLYDHNYTQNMFLPGNWTYIHDIEHSYCGQKVPHSEHSYANRVPDETLTPISIIHLEHNYCSSHVREDLDAGTDYEEDGDQEDITFNMINDTNF